jgi:hypothetical protein
MTNQTNATGHTQQIPLDTAQLIDETMMAERARCLAWVDAHMLATQKLLDNPDTHFMTLVAAAEERAGLRMIRQRIESGETP